MAAQVALTTDIGEGLGRWSLGDDAAHKIEHMHHDYSILAYAMNGKPLPELKGGPAPPAQ